MEWCVATAQQHGRHAPVTHAGGAQVATIGAVHGALQGRHAGQGLGAHGGHLARRKRGEQASRGGQVRTRARAHTRAAPRAPASYAHAAHAHTHTGTHDAQASTRATRASATHAATSRAKAGSCVRSAARARSSRIHKTSRTPKTTITQPRGSTGSDGGRHVRRGWARSTRRSAGGSRAWARSAPQCESLCFTRHARVAQRGGQRAQGAARHAALPPPSSPTSPGKHRRRSTHQGS